MSNSKVSTACTQIQKQKKSRKKISTRPNRCVHKYCVIILKYTIGSLTAGSMYTYIDVCIVQFSFIYSIETKRRWKGKKKHQQQLLSHYQRCSFAFKMQCVYVFILFLDAITFITLLLRIFSFWIDLLRQNQGILKSKKKLMN